MNTIIDYRIWLNPFNQRYEVIKLLPGKEFILLAGFDKEEDAQRHIKQIDQLYQMLALSEHCKEFNGRDIDKDTKEVV